MKQIAVELRQMPADVERIDGERDRVMRRGGGWSGGNGGRDSAAAGTEQLLHAPDLGGHDVQGAARSTHGAPAIARPRSRCQAGVDVVNVAP